MLDAESWKIVFEVYARHSALALSLAYQLTAVTQSLQRGPKGTPEALAALDQAIEALYPHTDFYKVGRKLFRMTIEGTISNKQEELISKLGVKK